MPVAILPYHATLCLFDRHFPTLSTNMTVCSNSYMTHVAPPPSWPSAAQEVVMDEAAKIDFLRFGSLGFV